MLIIIVLFQNLKPFKKLILIITKFKLGLHYQDYLLK